MNASRTHSNIALALLLTGGLMAAPAFAELPAKPGNVAAIDSNADGRIEKQEYLAYMGAQFDKRAASKGYCTYEEVESNTRNGFDVWGPNIGP